MKGFFLAIFAIFLIVLSALLFDISSVKASSVYDNAYQSTEELYLKNAYYSCNQEVNANWRSVVFDSLYHTQSMTDNPSATDDLETALETGSYAVVQNYQWEADGSPNSQNIYIFYNVESGVSLNWTNGYYKSVTMPGSHFISISNSSPNCDIKVYYNGLSSGTLSNSAPYPNPGSSNQKVYNIAGINPNYPENYEGELIDLVPQVPASVITPDYQYSVNANGLLSVTYLKNISPFLSGTNFFVLNKTSDNWETLGPQIFSESFTPAGWTDKTFEQLLDPGYYVLRISHSQTFDSNSPWYNSGIQVNDVFIEFFWDGQTTFTGTTAGCEGQVCNIFQTDESEKMWNMFENLGLGNDEFGLGAAVTAPLTFIATLPSKAANCTPISLTLPYVNREISLPCMTSIYQTHFGLIFSLFQTIMLGLFGYYAAVKVYGNIKQMKDPEDDRIEVVKL